MASAVLHVNVLDNFSENEPMIERRRKPRIQVAYPAVVRGENTAHGRFQNGAILDNLSSTGLYLRVNHFVNQDRPLFVLFQLSNTSDQGHSPRVAVRGRVVRIEPRSDGTCGLALKFERYRFL